MAREKIRLAHFTLFMIATASTDETYPSPFEPPLHTQSLVPGSNMDRISPVVFGNLSNTLSLKEVCLTQVLFFYKETKSCCHTLHLAGDS